MTFWDKVKLRMLWPWLGFEMCLQCGKVFYVRKSTSDYKNLYCSQECNEDSNREHNLGPFRLIALTSHEPNWPALAFGITVMLILAFGIVGLITLLGG